MWNNEWMRLILAHIDFSETSDVVSDQRNKHCCILAMQNRAQGVAQCSLLRWGRGIRSTEAFWDSQYMKPKELVIEAHQRVDILLGCSSNEDCVHLLCRLFVLPQLDTNLV